MKNFIFCVVSNQQVHIRNFGKTRCYLDTTTLILGECYFSRLIKSVNICNAVPVFWIYTRPYVMYCVSVIVIRNDSVT